jgi:hypothetical protein
MPVGSAGKPSTTPIYYVFAARCGTFVLLLGIMRNNRSGFGLRTYRLTKSEYPFWALALRHFSLFCSLDSLTFSSMNWS